MATNNLVIINDISVDTLQSCNRPLLVQYGYSGSDDIPKSVEVQAWGNVDGNWLEVGTPLIKGRDIDSPTNNPVFTFDFSDVCSRHLRSGFYDEILLQSTDTPVQLKNQGSNADYMGLSSFAFQAIAWYEDASGLLIKSDDDTLRNPAGDIVTVVGDLMLKDSDVISDKFENMGFAAAWNFDVIDSVTTKNRGFMTNCPTSITRRVSSAQPLILNLLQNKMSVHDLLVSYTNTAGAASTHVISSTAGSTDIDWYAWNVTPSDAYLFSVLSDLNTAGVKKDTFNFSMVDGSYQSKSLTFEVVDANANTNISRKDTTHIYWINDQNALDFYNFEGGLEIKHNNKKSTYAKSGKSFTSRTSSRHGIARGTTIETYTAHSLHVNRETAEWLAEIFRSKEVYMYSPSEKALIPISVLDGDVTLLSFNKKDSRVSVQFIKEVYTIKG